MEEASKRSAHLIMNPEEIARKRERIGFAASWARFARHVAELLQEMNISSIHYLIEVIAVSQFQRALHDAPRRRSAWKRASRRLLLDRAWPRRAAHFKRSKPAIETRTGTGRAVIWDRVGGQTDSQPHPPKRLNPSCSSSVRQRLQNYQARTLSHSSARARLSSHRCSALIKAQHP